MQNDESCLKFERTEQNDYRTSYFQSEVDGKTREQLDEELQWMKKLLIARVKVMCGMNSSNQVSIIYMYIMS